MKEVAVCHIIGGGISGLAAAFFLKKYCPDMYSVIYEANQNLGGKAYSEYDDAWNINLNNYLHTIFNTDVFMSRFVDENEWRQNMFFINMRDMSGSLSIKENFDIICKKICQIQSEKIATPVKQRLLRLFNKNSFSSLKFYASDSNFSQKFVNVLASFADEVHCSCRLSKIISRKQHITSLYFGNRKVKLGGNDKVIFAFGNSEACKFIDVNKLVYNCSVNIAYHTSQTVFLPQGVSFVGLREGIADWIVASPNILSAQIFNYKYQFTTPDKIALYVWDEISRIRGVNSSFMPSYRLEINDKASLKMTENNNSARPDNAATEYDNAFLCGDWTMKNYPCTLEVAVSSGKRAVRTMLKS